MVEQTAVRIPYGIADSGNNVAYLAGADGRIYCIDLRNGDVLASSERPGHPLTVHANALLGWAPLPENPSTFHLFSLERRGEKMIQNWEQIIPLPEKANIQSAEPGDFSVTAQFEKGHYNVTWEAHARYRGGAPPPAEVEEAASLDEARALRIDLQSGDIVSDEPIFVESQTAAQPPLPSLQPERYIVPYLSDSTWVTHPWKMAIGDAYLVRAEKEPGILLVTSDQSGEREIRLTDNADAQASVTIDGLHIFVQEPADNTIAWNIFSASSGELLGQLPFDSGTQGVAMVNDEVVYAVIELTGSTRRVSLKGRNLKNPGESWTFFLREEPLKGPPPPPR